MVATLQSRKEALEAKILEKNEELKKLCLQEADLTGIMPPEIPLEPGEAPPTIRRRIGTSFSFPQNLINNVKDADDESLTALELECKVQTNIAEAALALANDTSANKAVRRKHRLMYRQSQRRLMELETRLNLLRQGKSQHLKPQHIKKKPRPNTTAVENLGFLWNKTNNSNINNNKGVHLGSWPGKVKSDHSLDDIDGNKEFAHQTDTFGSLHRLFKSTGTSLSSESSRTDVETEEYKLGTNFLFNYNSYPNNLTTEFYSCSSPQDVETRNFNLNLNAPHLKRNNKKGIVRRQWDTQSAGSTLLPSQTYPDHSHLPNLSRTQSLGSVESNPQKAKDSWSVQEFSFEGNSSKEKEWYETSLDSAPSPPLRTTSKLPSTARMVYQMQEIQPQGFENWNNNNLDNFQPSDSHIAHCQTSNSPHKNIVRSASTYPVTETSSSGIDKLTNSIQQIHINPRERIMGTYQNNVGALSQKEYLEDCLIADFRQPFNFSVNINKPKLEDLDAHYQIEAKPKVEQMCSAISNETRYFPCTKSSGLPLNRQNSLNDAKFKSSNDDDLTLKKQNDSYKLNNTKHLNINENNPENSTINWLTDEEFLSSRKGCQIAVPQEYVFKSQPPTQPYYHVTKNSPGEKIKNLQYQAARNRHASIAEEQGSYQQFSPVHLSTHHPPHAITQNEISFDTVVPFESPQNHTVVQAGKWQPYREVTKPFEMSDFYKYSTKFRQNKPQPTRANTPDIATSSPNTMHQKGIYTPLKPMTCQPVESRSSQVTMSNQMDAHCDETEKTLVEVSPPEIV